MPKKKSCRKRRKEETERSTKEGQKEKANQRVRKAQEKATNLKGKLGNQAVASTMEVPPHKIFK